MRGASGALYLQSTTVGQNAARGFLRVAQSCVSGVDGRVSRNVTP